MRRSVASIIAGIVGGLIFSGLAVAQEGTLPRGPDAGPSRSEEPRRVEEAQPSLYYLKDKQGNLLAVPNFGFEEFERLYRLKFAPDEQRPRYSIQQMSAAGTANAGYAELTIQFRILVRDEQWVRVPLRLDQALLREPAQYQGPTEQFLHFEGGGEGYVSWIRGQPGQQQHQLTLKVLVPLATVGEETRLRLLAPRTTASELKLKVPVAGAIARVSEGATLQALSAPAGKGETEFTVVGLGAEFEVTWSRPAARMPEVPAVLESVGTISARIDNRGIETEALLQVRSFGAAFDRFRVHLPPEAEYVPGVPSGYTVAPVEPGDFAATRQRTVEVRLSRKPSAQPAEVRLTTRRTCDTTKSGTWFELCGFDVIGAARQWGALGVTATPDWQVLWGPSRGMRQMDQLPEALRRKDAIAAFGYAAQPSSLAVRLVGRQTRIRVEPEYVLLVGADQVRLDARLKYTVHGPKVFALDVAMPGWQIDEVESEDNTVAGDAVPRGEVQSLSIPLLQPAAGQISVRLRAHRTVPRGAKTLEIPLPQPQASTVEPLVVVQPADNIELIPDSKAMIGLVRQAAAAAPKNLPSRQQAPLVYRGDGPRVVFAAELRRHAQRIAAEVASQLRLEESRGEIEQRLAYTVAYESTDYLVIEVPRELAQPGRLEIRRDDQVVLPVVLGEGSASRPVRMRVPLGKACIGPCELTLRYALPLARPADGSRETLIVPLVMPAEADLLSNRLSVAWAAGLRVKAGPGDWTAAETAAQAGQHGAVQLTANRRSAQVQLDVQWEAGGQEGATVVERAWVQTWLSGPVRQDRAVFQFTTDRRDVQVALPAGAVREQLSVVLDGKRAVTAAAGENVLVVALPADSATDRHLLELRYELAGQRPPRGAMSLELPRLGREVWVRRMYWQLVLPAHEHLTGGPSGFTGEFRWGWNGYYWGRQPLLSQAQLESWVGLARRPGPPARDVEIETTSRAAGNVNGYLFSAYGHVEGCELRTAGRTWIVLAASAAALVAGLLLIYVPRTRHPASLLVSAVVLVAMGTLYPEPALLVAQAAVLGLVLALAAGVMALVVARRHRPPRALESPGPLRPGSPVSQSEFGVPIGEPSPTQTSPAVVVPPADAGP